MTATVTTVNSRRFQVNTERSSALMREPESLAMAVMPASVTRRRNVGDTAAQSGRRTTGFAAWAANPDVGLRSGPGALQAGPGRPVQPVGAGLPGGAGVG